ncbi:hypothetical protein ABZP36_010787 [Zizania latifolia]
MRRTKTAGGGEKNRRPQRYVDARGRTGGVTRTGPSTGGEQPSSSVTGNEAEPFDAGWAAGVTRTGASTREGTAVVDSPAMAGAVLVAIAASIGNLLQGWDNAIIAYAGQYIKKEFNLKSELLIAGLIVAMSLIGAMVMTTFSGAVADAVGRRPMLIVSAVLYFVSGLVMLWAPSMHVLLLARFIGGLGIGLAVTLVPLYISETAPTGIRGRLNTLPQFSGSGGMSLSYCLAFRISLMPQLSWRVMLDVLSIPSLLYFALTVFYLPESPRWLVSKGRLAEAKREAGAAKPARKGRCFRHILQFSYGTQKLLFQQKAIGSSGLVLSNKAMSQDGGKLT